MNENAPLYTGGCQCGAIRFKAQSVGRASICHCRMCQKAFGAFYAPFVTGHGVEWTRGSPKYFASSSRALRGFCADCGTPLTYQADGGGVELAIGAFDDPTRIAPTIQVNPTDKLPYVDSLAGLPMRGPGDNADNDSFLASVVSHQHPDHDTAEWPAKR
jgi:hypothetical protein